MQSHCVFCRFCLIFANKQSGMTKTKTYINREISWLHFNDRVLQEAMDANNPLIERLRFLGIYSNNRDEFFRVRVATLKRMILVDKTKEENPGYNPAKVLKEVFDLVEGQEKKFNQTFLEIKKGLEDNNIFFVDETEMNSEQELFVKSYFHDKVRPLLFPIMLNSLQSTDVLRDKYIYLAVVLSDVTGLTADDYALVMVPTNQLSRFLLLPSSNDKKYIILLDDVIRFCLKQIFLPFGFNLFKAYTIKFTRDAELDIDHDISKSFYELMSESVKKRKMGMPVRFVYDNDIPPILLNRLLKKLKISDTDSLRGGSRYHNFRDFIGFPNPGNKSLVYPAMPPLKYYRLPENSSIIKEIAKQDLMLHFPYQSFQYVVDLLREASVDPKVRAIKMTFYRAARNSNVINSLINAARNGKNVTVFLEIQARFDEQANIYWAGRLKEEGVKIIKNLPGYKVHAKLMLIRRKEAGRNVYYTNISTGNFNEQTATVYADDSLFTANQEIAKEVNMLFHLFESPYTPPKFKHLLVSPYYLRNKIIKLINREIKNVRAGKEAWIIIKINNLVDEAVVKKLYRASQEGVHIQILSRGICTLVPGIKGVSENITVTGIIDRFLEHSRVFVFANQGVPKYYISSADWMSRNFDHRFEVACPIYDEKIQKELFSLLKIQLSDNTKCRSINAPVMNEYKKPKKGEKPVRAQFALYHIFQQMEKAETEVE